MALNFGVKNHGEKKRVQDSENLDGKELRVIDGIGVKMTYRIRASYVFWCELFTLVKGETTGLPR